MDAPTLVIMAAGGCGDLYPITVYPKGICGDSYAIAARAGAEMTDMEFIQFEPCCLTEPKVLRGKGISTTLMNAGGRLLNARGEEFLSRYFRDPAEIQKGELARAICDEAMACGGKPCLYDLTSVPLEEIKAHCVFYPQLMQAGTDPKTTLLPVMPAAHTFLGGIRVNSRLCASLKRLYAAGENMGGLHGANRIGGCAGAEIVTLGAVAGKEASTETRLSDAEHALAERLAGELTESYPIGAQGCRSSMAAILFRLRETVEQKLNLLRDAQGLEDALDEIAALSSESEELSAAGTEELVDLISLKNMLLTARMIAEASRERKESRGVFFRRDYPYKDPVYERSTVLKMR